MTKERIGAQQRFASIAPWLFVFLWSTGFIVARYATDDADPLSFLAARLFIAALVLGAIASVSGAPRPSLSQSKWSIVVGFGIHATYLGGVFIAIDLGLPSGVGALVGGLHPVITAVAGGALLGERLSPRQWFGVILGFSGVVLVVDGDGTALRTASRLRQRKRLRRLLHHRLQELQPVLHLQRLLQPAGLLLLLRPCDRQ